MKKQSNSDKLVEEFLNWCMQKSEIWNVCYPVTSKREEDETD